MSLSLRLLSQVLAAVTFVQASHLFSKTNDQNGSKNRLIRSPQWNATTAQNKIAVGNPTTSSNRPNIPFHPLQHVKLGLSKPAIVQECANGTGDIVVQDCTCSTQQLAAQAIDDAVTMVQAVKGVGNDPGYAPILQQYMGGFGYASCQQSSSFIDGRLPKRMAACKNSQRTETLESLVNIQAYQWLPYDPHWLSNKTGDVSNLISAYCATGVPPQQPQFTARCNQDSPFGWVYTTNGAQVCLPPKTNSVQPN